MRILGVGLLTAVAVLATGCPMLGVSGESEFACAAAGDCSGGKVCVAQVCRPACGSSDACGAGTACMGGGCVPQVETAGGATSAMLGGSGTSSTSGNGSSAASANASSGVVASSSAASGEASSGVVANSSAASGNASSVMVADSSAASGEASSGMVANSSAASGNASSGMVANSSSAAPPSSGPDGSTSTDRPSSSSTAGVQSSSGLLVPSSASMMVASSASSGVVVASSSAVGSSSSAAPVTPFCGWFQNPDQSACFTFDSPDVPVGAAVLDESGWSHNITALGTATLVDGGRVNRGLRCNKMDSVTVTQAALAPTFNGMTVEMWVKPASLPPTNKEDVLLELKGSMRLTVQSNGAVQCTVDYVDAGSVTMGPTRATSSAGVMAAMTWTHVACAASRANVKVFINGSPDGSSDAGMRLLAPGDILGANAGLRLCNANPVAPASLTPFGGTVDCIRMWSAARGPQKIADGLDCGFGP